MQLYMFAGEMSAFHSFRTSIKARRESGQFAFLKAEETPADLLTAPFDFEYVLRPTTYWPLVAGLALGIASMDSRVKDEFSFGDAAFTAGVSYNAGVGEEALFRGYLMPVLRERIGSDGWSNVIQGTAFGAAHYSERNKLPVFQTLAGYYLGWLTQRNEWSLRESIFLHAWWDVLAIGFDVADGRVDNPIMLPGLTFTY